MAPTVEKHEKKKSSIRRLLSPVIFSSIGGSNSNNSDHGRGESHFRRRKTEQVIAATSPSSSSSSPSSPSTSLRYYKGHGTPPASSFRGNSGRAGSSVETAFVGTTPAEQTRVAANVDQNCQRTSYGIPRRIIQRRQSTSSCGASNDDEMRNKRAPVTPLYGSIINRVAADVQDGSNHNNYEDCYRRTNTRWDSDNPSTEPANANQIADFSQGHHNHFASQAVDDNRVVNNKCYEYDQTGLYGEEKSNHRDGRSSAPPDAPYSQYYNRGSCTPSSPIQMAPPTTSPSSAESTLQTSTSHNNKYATTHQWTTVVNERNETLTTRCTTILRPQPLYTSASGASPGATASITASRLRNISPSGAAYGYAYITPKSPSALPIPVSSAQHSFVRSGPHRRTVSECETTYSVARGENTNYASSRRPSTPTATPYECTIPKNSLSGAVSSVAASVPIFKRGTLQSPPAVPPHKPQLVGATTGSNTSPKKVSFPSSTASTAVYWPTRRGMTVDPPCRQSGQSNRDGVAPTSVTGAVDVEAAYAAVYANTGANSPCSADSENGNFSRTSPHSGTTVSHQVAVPLSPPENAAQITHLAPQVLPQCCPTETSDYAAVSVAHSIPYIPHSTAGGRSYASIQQHHNGEARYKQQPHGQQEYGTVYMQCKSQPVLYDQPPQVQQIRARQFEFSRRECEYRSMQPPSESESGSEAGEIRKILQTNGHGTGARMDKEVRKIHLNRREDPRRHTLSTGHHLARTARTATTIFNSQNNVNIDNYLDLEVRNLPISRIYPLANSTLFDDDPGIMSEVETSSTGFRRGSKQRSSLPIVRTMSKTLERPLGLVFLQYRHETKRSLLPNEITSLATVKALFVRSFPKQLTMEYLDSPRVRIYIHDSKKDMFYELEDHRSNLNEIRDHSVLRLFEMTDKRDGAVCTGISNPIQRWNDPEQSYFSEPEFDSEFQHQHIHKNKLAKSNWAHQPYYLTPAPLGSSATLPHNGSVVRPFSSAMPTGAAISKSPRARLLSTLEKGAIPARGYSPYSRQFSDDAYSSQYSSRASSTTPIIDEETSDTEILEDIYGLYSRARLPVATMTGTSDGQSATFSLVSSTPVTTAPPLDTTRIRVEHMERQLANLTGLVQKALTQTVPVSSAKDHDSGLSSVSEVNFLDKSASSEKSVLSYEVSSENTSSSQHSPQYTEQERLKPALPSKPPNLSNAAATYDGNTYFGDLKLTPEMYNQLRGLQKKTKDLRHELRNLRRMSQSQAHSIKESVRDTFVKIRSVVLSGGESLWSGGADSERIRITHEEEIYKEDIKRLEDDLTELESTVEELRSNVINRKTRVNMTDVENMALVLSKSSKTVADLRLKFPQLQGAMKSVMSSEMQRVIAEENFLKEEPERLESALKRCKKLTGTLVTLKRLASVQEQRLPDGRTSPTFEESHIPNSEQNNRNEKAMACSSIVASEASKGSNSNINTKCNAYIINTFDPLREELKTTVKVENNRSGNTHGMNKCTNNTSYDNNTSMLHRLHSYPSYSDAKPVVPEPLVDFATRRVPPPPPLRTTSKSPLASPTNPIAPMTHYYPTSKGFSNLMSNKMGATNNLDGPLIFVEEKRRHPSTSTSSSCESINSQESLHQPYFMTPHLQNRQLEKRHHELLEKQRVLQERCSRLQQLQQTSPPDLLQVQKNGSKRNTVSKIGMTFGPENCGPPTSGSISVVNSYTNPSQDFSAEAKIRVYETDIL